MWCGVRPFFPFVRNLVLGLRLKWYCCQYILLATLKIVFILARSVSRFKKTCRFEKCWNYNGHKYIIISIWGPRLLAFFSFFPFFFFFVSYNGMIGRKGMEWMGEYDNFVLLKVGPNVFTTYLFNASWHIWRREKREELLQSKVHDYVHIWIWIFYGKIIICLLN